MSNESSNKRGRYRADKLPCVTNTDESETLSSNIRGHRNRRIKIEMSNHNEIMQTESTIAKLNENNYTSESSSRQVQIGKTNDITHRNEFLSINPAPTSDSTSQIISVANPTERTDIRGRRRSQSTERTAPNRLSQKYFDIGNLEYQCEYCNALFWYRERCIRSSVHGHVRYNLCCHGGRVDLSRLRPPPPLLYSLLCNRDHPLSHHFRQNIIKYNLIFAFTSMGARIDDRINDGHGPYVFRVSGQVCHLMGSILPPNGHAPAFAQLYMHDTANEIANRMSSFRSNSKSDTPREEIVEQIRFMLDTHNTIVRAYRSVSERLVGVNLPEYKLCIRNNPFPDRPQYSTPQASEIVALVVGDLSAEERQRDLIVEHRSNGLQRVSSTHSLYMPLQYPLLFPYGEPGYRLGIKYRRDRPGGESRNGFNVTMLEYYQFRLHPRFGETSLIFYGGRLFQQYLLDAYACVEQARLHYLQKHHVCLVPNCKRGNIMFALQFGRLQCIRGNIMSGFSAEKVAKDEDSDNEDLPEKIKAIVHKRFLFTVTINELSLRESNLRFTVKRVQPVPADTSNFVPVNEQILQLENVESHGKSPVVLTETGLTLHAKNLKITMSDQKSKLAHSSTSTTTVPSPRPKRKIDFQHADDFVMINQIKETQDDSTDLR